MISYAKIKWPGKEQKTEDAGAVARSGAYLNQRQIKETTKVQKDRKETSSQLIPPDEIAETIKLYSS